MSLKCYSQDEACGVPAHSRIALFSGYQDRFLLQCGVPSDASRPRRVCQPYLNLTRVNFPRSLKYFNLLPNPIEQFNLCGPRNRTNLWLSHPLHLWRISSSLSTPNSSILQSSKSEPRSLKLQPHVVDLNKADNCVNRINPLKLPNWKKSVFYGYSKRNW